MKVYNGVTLKYKGTRRNSYMSLTDLAQDLTTESLLEVLPTLVKLKNQMVIMTEIEKREELSEDEYFDLLDTCNGI